MDDNYRINPDGLEIFHKLKLKITITTIKDSIIIINFQMYTN